jgi:ParB family chromosome partitioning protein
VREVEQAVRSLQATPVSSNERLSDPHMDALADRLKQRLGTRVALRASRGGKGKIVIDYFSAAELDRLLAVLLA